MRRKYILVMIIMVCVLGLVGCEPSEEARAQKYEYTHIDTMLRHIIDDGMPIGDWGYGTGNENSYSDKFDVDSPIFTIHVNPLADEELIDLYVGNLMVIDAHMAQNSEYLKYIRKNHPYCVSFDCLGNEIMRVQIDGNVDDFIVKSDLVLAVEPIREEAEEQLRQFDTFLKSYKDIQVSGNGQYYYVLDSKNLSDSIAPVMQSIEEIRAAYPFSEEDISGLYGSFKRIGILGGGYQIYFDRYDNDPLLSGDLFDFAYNSQGVYNCAYSHFVPTGTLDEEPLRTYYYCRMCEDEMDNKAFCGYENSAPMTVEEVDEIFWTIYDMIMTEHEEHGIKAFTDLELNGTCMLKDDPQGLGYETRGFISRDILDRRLSKEQFCDLLERNSYTFNPADRQLPD